MRDQELVSAIRRLKVETGSLACMGCGHEHNCGVSGCSVMREAADRIANQSTHVAALQQEIEKLRGQNKQLREAAALVAKESAELLERRWIPVKKRLPGNGVPVLINYIGNDGKYYPDGTAVWTECGCFWWEGSLEDCDTEVAVPITHWMPLPEPPEVVPGG